MHDLIAPCITQGDPDLESFSRAFVGILVELTLRPPASVTQQESLALALARLWEVASLNSLHHHAELLARQGAAIRLQNSDVKGADHFYFRAEISCDRRRVNGLRLDRQLTRWLAGYGFRPYRVLVWWAVSIAIFTVAYLLALEDLGDALTFSLASQLGSVGFSDIEAVPDYVRTLSLVQTSIGLLAVSVFFALVLRRWFKSH